mgnify:FL=1
MKKILLSLFISICFGSVLIAQGYTTPGTGLVYSLDDLLTDSPSTISVSGTTYTLVDDLTKKEK